MRRLATLVGAAVALIAVVALALPLLVDAERFRPQVEAQLRQSLGRKVELGKLSFRVLPSVAVRAAGLTVGEDAAYASGRPFLKAESLDVRVPLLPILTGREWTVSALVVSGAEVELIRRGGKWNFASLGGSSKDQQGGGARLDELRLTNLRVARTEEQEARIEYPSADITVRGIAPGAPVDFTIDAPVLNASGRASAKGDVERATVQLRALPAAWLDIGVDGEISGDAEWDGKAAKGALALRNGRRGQAAFGEVAAKFAMSPERLDALDVSVGKLTAHAAGRLPSAADGPLDLQVDVARAPIGELLRLGAAFGQGLPKGMQADGFLEAKLQVQGARNAPRLTGRIAASALNLSGGEIKQPVRMSALEVDLTPEAIRSRPVEVQCGPTKLSGYFSVRDYSSARPVLESAWVTEGANLADLLQMAQAYGGADASAKASGKATLRVRVHGPLVKGAALEYQGKAQLDGAVVEWPTLTQPVRVDSAAIDFAQTSARVEKLRLRTAGTTVEGSVQATSFAPLSVRFDLRADTLDAEQWQKLSRGGGGGKSSGAPKLTAEGTLAAGAVKWNRIATGAAKAQAALRDGVLRLEPVSAALYGGTLAGRIGVDLRGAQPKITMDTKLDRIESGALLEAVASLPRVMAGPLSGTVGLAMEPQGNEPPMRSLSGAVSLKMGAGRLETANLLGELGGLARFVQLPGGRNAGAMTQFIGLTGDMTIARGVADVKGLRFDMEDAIASLSGTANFNDQTLNLRLLSTLNRKLADTVGGTRIGGYLTSAVTNAAGELIIPALVSGTLARPRFAPDAATVAKLKLRSVAPALSQDPKTVIDAIKGGREGVRGVLDILRGGERKKQ
ncbi:MAG: AsmA family protein [Bryobacterales bacterium]|nr:AsmA family protein [Bryobacterales bacterium]